MTDGRERGRPPRERPSRPRLFRGPLLLFLVGTGLLTLANGIYLLVVGPAIERHGHTEAVIGAIVATGGLSALVLRVPAGNAFRSGRATLLIAGGAALAGAGYALLPTTSVGILLAGFTAMQGAGFAIATTGGMAGLMDRRPQGVGAATLMGWYTGSIGGGYGLAGFAGGVLADGIGVGGALITAGVLAVASAVLTAGALERMPPEVPHGDEDVGARLGGWIRGVPAGAWAGFAVALYINLVNGAALAFFPLYALGIGLSLAQVGVLSGIHGTLASVVRFGSGAVLERISYPLAVPGLVLVIGFGVGSISILRGMAALALMWSAVGLARGILRVASGAMVVEAAGKGEHMRGRASGVYLAGLDLGNFLGPLLGGLASEVVGLRWSFAIVGILPAAPFLVAAAALGRRGSWQAGRGEPPDLY